MDTVAAISTPPGAGGIAVVRVSGPAAYDVAAAVFRPKNEHKQIRNAVGYTALLGDFLAGGRRLDEGIALCFRAPHSYTGEDVVELSCHGGEVVTAELLRACLSAGAVPAPPGEYTRRALLNGRISLTQAEAVMDVISAASRQGAALAGGALAGRLAEEIGHIRQQLVSLAGHLAAYVDYPEEDVQALAPDVFLETLRAAREELQTMLEGYNSGMMLRRGVTAAIVGSPNVGKSTLFNLMSGFERAIVTPVAGTTRDVVRECVQLGGVPLMLADTAGLHNTEDIVEVEGIRRSYAELEQAGLVLAVFDGALPLGEAELALAKACEGRPAVGILNKSDLGTAAAPEAILPYFSEVISVSAQDPASRTAIEAAVLRVLKLSGANPDAMNLANERQFTAAKAAHAALQEAEQALLSGLALDAAGVCLDDALYALATLTGENVSEAVINDVFSKFCVGK